MAVVLTKKTYEAESAQVAVKLTASLDTPASITIKDVTTDPNGVDFRFVDENPAIVRDKLEQAVLAFNRMVFENASMPVTQLTITPFA